MSAVRIPTETEIGSRVHVKTKMDGGEMRDTGHGRLLPRVGSALTSGPGAVAAP
jgi:hypothetical protein